MQGSIGSIEYLQKECKQFLPNIELHRFSISKIFRLVKILGNSDLDYSQLRGTTIRNKLNYIKCSFAALLNEEIEEQVTYLYNKYGFRNVIADKNVSFEVLERAAEILLFISFCPEKAFSYSGLQFLEQLAIENKSKQQMITKAVEDIHDSYFDNLFPKLNKLKEESRYHNWYHGYTKVELPYFNSAGLDYHIDTSITFGSIRTQFFGDNYDPDKIDKKLSYKILMSMNHLRNPNCTLSIFIEKISMRATGNNNGIQVKINGDESKVTEEGMTVYYFNSSFNDKILIEYRRNVTSQEITLNPLIGIEKLPGFKMTWKYDEDLEPIEKYKEYNEDYRR